MIISTMNTIDGKAVSQHFGIVSSFVVVGVSVTELTDETVSGSIPEPK